MTKWNKNYRKIKKRKPKTNESRRKKINRQIFPLKILKDNLRKYDSIGLISTLAGLQLHPENHSQLFRLEFLTQIAGSFSNKNKEKLNLSELENFVLNNLNSKSVVGLEEDPLEYLFTDNIIFMGGNYLIFPGISHNSTLILQTFLDCIFQGGYHLSLAYVIKISNACISLLTISNHIATSLNYKRFMKSPDRWREELQFPEENRMKLLTSAVTFDIDKINDLLKDVELDYNSILPFTLEIGAKEFSNTDLNNNPLLLRPFIKMDDKIILASPASIATALCHYIIDGAMKLGILKDLLESYRKISWRIALKNIFEMDYRPINNIELPKFEKDLPIEEAIFQIDINKIAYVQLIVDDARNYEKDNINGVFFPQKFFNNLIMRQLEIAEFLKNSADLKCRNILILILCSGIGRQFAFPALQDDEKNITSLAFLLQDLEFILTRKVDYLTLWKFSDVFRKFTKNHIVIPNSIIDLYAVYKNGNYSFPKGNSKFYNFGFGNARNLRLNSRITLDVHAVYDKKGKSFIPVRRKFFDKEIPIYVQNCVFRKDWEDLVESFDCPIWIYPKFGCETEIDNFLDIYCQITEFFSYWVWQLTPEICKWINKIKAKVILIEYEIEDPRYWMKLNDDYSFVNPPIFFKSMVNENKIKIKIPKLLRNYFHSENNLGEILVISELLKTFKVLFEKSGIICYLNDEEIKIILEKIAPLGNKKKIFLINTKSNPILNPLRDPINRFIQSHDIQESADGLIEDLGMEYPPEKIIIEKKERTKLIKKIVDVYMHRIKKRLSKHSIDDLLEFLIRYNETLLWHNEFHRLTIPPRISCYSNYQSIIQKNREEEFDLNIASLCSRVLIEIISSEPFRGEKTISVDDLDRLLALTYQLINWATISDQIHLGLFDPDLYLLPSGRIGKDVVVYKETLSNFIDQKTEENLERYVAHFSEFFREINLKSIECEEINELNSVYKAEFGVNFEELTNFFNYLLIIGLKHNNSFMKMELIKLKQQIIEVLHFSEEKFFKIIDLFSLKSRKKWEEVPKGFNNVDIWPWRYNRRLSYMRRPLILVGNFAKNPMVYWGTRHVYRASKELFNLIISGRYKIYGNTSDEMKKFKAKILDEIGKNFVRRVQNWFTDNTKLRVESNVSINQGSPLYAEEDLGDIDLLVFDHVNKKIFSIECKNIRYGRNPREMANEIKSFFGKHKEDIAWIKKHLKRDDWIRNNLKLIAIKFGEDLTGFSLQSLFLTAEELPVTFIKNMPIPFISFTKIKRDGFLCSLKSLMKEN